MDEELRRAKIEYLLSRLETTKGELREGEQALGVTITEDNWRAIADDVAGAVREAGNPSLADRYLGTLDGFHSALAVSTGALRTGDQAGADIAQEALDEAEEEHERVAAELRAWFESSPGKAARDAGSGLLQKIDRPIRGGRYG